MDSLRTFLRARTWLVAAILVAALGLRVAVPQGFMPSFERGIEVTLCTGTGPAHATIPIEKQGPSAAERCAFADLSTPMLGGVDPILLALALAFVLALWLVAPRAFPLRATAHLRPPLRGPPATA